MGTAQLTTLREFYRALEEQNGSVGQEIANALAQIAKPGKSIVTFNPGAALDYPFAGMIIPYKKRRVGPQLFPSEAWLGECATIITDIQLRGEAAFWCIAAITKYREHGPKWPRPWDIYIPYSSASDDPYHLALQAILRANSPDTTQTFSACTPRQLAAAGIFGTYNGARVTADAVHRAANHLQTGRLIQ